MLQSIVDTLLVAVLKEIEAVSWWGDTAGKHLFFAVRSPNCAVPGPEAGAPAHQFRNSGLVSGESLMCKRTTAT